MIKSLNFREKYLVIILFNPFRVEYLLDNSSQGVALGWDIIPLRGIRLEILK